jgi:hypothetical protein
VNVVPQEVDAEAAFPRPATQSGASAIGYAGVNSAAHALAYVETVDEL